jgi:HAD superfamily phosphatase (TIGR01668 family)
MSLIAPDDYLSSVVLIDPDALSKQGFRVALLDIDNTLVPRDTHVLPDETREWVARLKECGLRPCLITNNWHKIVFTYAEELGVPIVYKAMKPLPFSYLRALKKVNHEKGEGVVVVGDQIFTDILGAKILGYRGILLLPQAGRDLWYTLLLRRLERLLLGTQGPRE